MAIMGNNANDAWDGFWVGSDWPAAEPGTRSPILSDAGRRSFDHWILPTLNARADILSLEHTRLHDPSGPWYGVLDAYIPAGSAERIAPLTTRSRNSLG